MTVYEAEAERWQQSRGAPLDELGRRFRAQVGNGLVADLGCGPGRYLPQIGAPVVGLDVSGAMLSFARRHPYPLVQADLESLPLCDRSLVGAFARHSYLHLPRARATYGFAELHRALRAGGLLMISLIEGSYEGRDLPGDEFPGRYFAFWTAPDLAAALGRAGFSEISVERVRRPKGEQDLLATARS